MSRITREAARFKLYAASLSNSLVIIDYTSLNIENSHSSLIIPCSLFFVRLGAFVSLWFPSRAPGASAYSLQPPSTQQQFTTHYSLFITHFIQFTQKPPAQRFYLPAKHPSFAFLPHCYRNQNLPSSNVSS